MCEKFYYLFFRFKVTTDIFGQNLAQNSQPMALSPRQVFDKPLSSNQGLRCAVSGSSFIFEVEFEKGFEYVIEYAIASGVEGTLTSSAKEYILVVKINGEKASASGETINAALVTEARQVHIQMNRPAGANGYAELTIPKSLPPPPQSDRSSCMIMW